MSKIIDAARINNLQARIELLLANGSGDKGYGQPVGSFQVTTENIITADTFNSMYDDMNTIYTHQTGESLNDAMPVIATRNIVSEDNSYIVNDFGEVLTDPDGTKKTITVLESKISELENNRFVMHPSQANISTAVTSRRSRTWNGIIFHEFDVTFPQGYNHCRHFFNSGGEIRITSNISGANTPKGNDWASFLSSIGTVKFNYNFTTGTNFLKGVGFYQLTTEYQEIYKKIKEGDFSGNTFSIFAKLTADSVVTFKVVYDDVHTGTDDYNVDGTLINTIQFLKADGVVKVGLPVSATIQGLDSFEEPFRYTIIPSKLSVSEGDSISFDFNISPKPKEGASYTWKINENNSTLTTVDFSDGIMNGTVLFDSTNSFTLIKNVLLDSITDDGESFYVELIETINNDSVVVGYSPVITVSNVSIIYTITPSSTNVNEGDTLTYTITAEPYAIPNKTYGWVIATTTNRTDRVNNSDFIPDEVNGQLVFDNNNQATVELDIKNDLITEGKETIEFHLTAGNFDPIASAPIVYVNDTSTGILKIQFDKDEYRYGDDIQITFSFEGKINLPTGYVLRFYPSGYLVSDSVDGVEAITAETVVVMKNSSGTSTLRTGSLIIDSNSGEIITEGLWKNLQLDSLTNPTSYTVGTDSIIPLNRSSVFRGKIREFKVLQNLQSIKQAIYPIVVSIFRSSTTLNEIEAGISINTKYYGPSGNELVNPGNSIIVNNTPYFYTIKAIDETTKERTTYREGEVITFRFTADPEPQPDTRYMWEYEGPFTNADFDLTNSTPNKSIIQFNNNTATTQLSLNNDFVTEGNQTLRVGLWKADTNGNAIFPVLKQIEITIVDGTTRFYNLTADKTEVFEGESVEFELEVNPYDQGNYYWYDIGTSSGNDFTDNKYYGSEPLVFNGNEAKFTRSIAFDSTNETNDYIDMVVTTKQGSSSNPVAGPVRVNIKDIEYTYSIDVDKTEVSEGDVITYTMTADPKPPQETTDTFYWYMTSDSSVYPATSASSTDFANISSSYGTFTFDSDPVNPNKGIAKLSLQVKTDASITEQTEYIKLAIGKNGRTDSYIVATSPTTLISDTVFTYSITSDKTTVNEGDSVTFTFTALNGLRPSTEYWWFDAGSTDGLDYTNSLDDTKTYNGKLSFDNSEQPKCVVTLSIDSDQKTEGQETIIMQLRSDRATGPVLETANTVYINDSSTSPITPGEPTVTASLSTYSATLGETITLNWDASYVTKVEFAISTVTSISLVPTTSWIPGGTSPTTTSLSGTHLINESTVSSNYKVYFRAYNGTKVKSSTLNFSIVAKEVPLPVIEQLYWDPASIEVNQKSYAKWEVSNASSIKYAITQTNSTPLDSSTAWTNTTKFNTLTDIGIVYQAITESAIRYIHVKAYNTAGNFVTKNAKIAVSTIDQPTLTVSTSKTLYQYTETATINWTTSNATKVEFAITNNSTFPISGFTQVDLIGSMDILLSDYDYTYLYAHIKATGYSEITQTRKISIKPVIYDANASNLTPYVNELISVDYTYGPTDLSHTAYLLTSTSSTQPSLTSSSWTQGINKTFTSATTTHLHLKIDKTVDNIVQRAYKYVGQIVVQPIPTYSYSILANKSGTITVGQLGTSIIYTITATNGAEPNKTYQWNHSGSASASIFNSTSGTVTFVDNTATVTLQISDISNLVNNTYVKIALKKDGTNTVLAESDNIELIKQEIEFQEYSLNSAYLSKSTGLKEGDTTRLTYDITPAGYTGPVDYIIVDSSTTSPESIQYNWNTVYGSSTDITFNSAGTFNVFVRLAIPNNQYDYAQINNITVNPNAIYNSQIIVNGNENQLYCTTNDILQFNVSASTELTGNLNHTWELASTATATSSNFSEYPNTQMEWNSKNSYIQFIPSNNTSDKVLALTIKNAGLNVNTTKNVLIERYTKYEIKINDSTDDVVLRPGNQFTVTFIAGPNKIRSGSTYTWGIKGQTSGEYFSSSPKSTISFSTSSSTATVTESFTLRSDLSSIDNIIFELKETNSTYNKTGVVVASTEAITNVSVNDENFINLTVSPDTNLKVNDSMSYTWESAGFDKIFSITPDDPDEQALFSSLAWSSTSLNGSTSTTMTVSRHANCLKHDFKYQAAMKAGKASDPNFVYYKPGDYFVRKEISVHDYSTDSGKYLNASITIPIIFLSFYEDCKPTLKNLPEVTWTSNCPDVIYEISRNSTPSSDLTKWNTNTTKTIELIKYDNTNDYLGENLNVSNFFDTHFSDKKYSHELLYSPSINRSASLYIHLKHGSLSKTVELKVYDIILYQREYNNIYIPETDADIIKTNSFLFNKYEFYHDDIIYNISNMGTYLTDATYELKLNPYVGSLPTISTTGLELPLGLNSSAEVRFTDENLKGYYKITNGTTPYIRYSILRNNIEVGTSPYFYYKTRTGIQSYGTIKLKYKTTTISEGKSITVSYGDNITISISNGLKFRWLNIHSNDNSTSIATLKTDLEGNGSVTIPLESNTIGVKSPSYLKIKHYDTELASFTLNIKNVPSWSITTNKDSYTEGEPGELLITGPANTTGYLHFINNTSDTITPVILSPLTSFTFDSNGEYGFDEYKHLITTRLYGDPIYKHLYVYDTALPTNSNSYKAYAKWPVYSSVSWNFQYSIYNTPINQSKTIRLIGPKSVYVNISVNTVNDFNTSTLYNQIQTVEYENVQSTTGYADITLSSELYNTLSIDSYLYVWASYDTNSYLNTTKVRIQSAIESQSFTIKPPSSTTIYQGETSESFVVSGPLSGSATLSINNSPSGVSLSKTTVQNDSTFTVTATSTSSIGTFSIKIKDNTTNVSNSDTTIQVLELNTAQLSVTINPSSPIVNQACTYTINSQNSTLLQYGVSSSTNPETVTDWTSASTSGSYTFKTTGTQYFHVRGTQNDGTVIYSYATVSVQSSTVTTPSNVREYAIIPQLSDKTITGAIVGYIEIHGRFQTTPEVIAKYIVDDSWISFPLANGDNRLKTYGVNIKFATTESSSPIDYPIKLVSDITSRDAIDYVSATSSSSIEWSNEPTTINISAGPIKLNNVTFLSSSTNFIEITGTLPYTASNLTSIINKLQLTLKLSKDAEWTVISGVTPSTSSSSEIIKFIVPVDKLADDFKKPGNQVTVGLRLEGVSVSSIGYTNSQVKYYYNGLHGYDHLKYTVPEKKIYVDSFFWTGNINAVEKASARIDIHLPSDTFDISNLQMVFEGINNSKSVVITDTILNDSRGLVKIIKNSNLLTITITKLVFDPFISNPTADPNEQKWATKVKFIIKDRYTQNVIVYDVPSNLGSYPLYLRNSIGEVGGVNSSVFY